MYAHRLVFYCRDNFHSPRDSNTEHVEMGTTSVERPGTISQDQQTGDEEFGEDSRKMCYPLSCDVVKTEPSVIMECERVEGG